jgi:SAM-dependent methyltransferase
MRVLDVPCGQGRISGRLAVRGCQVVGVDTNARFLELAREQYPAVAFERGDMRSLSYEAQFDAVVNWFTSFGYFDAGTNDAVLRGFARALRPGGRLLLEVHNAWRLRRAIEAGAGSTAMVFERGQDLLMDRVTYEATTRQTRTERFIVRDGRVRKLEFFLEQFPAPELIRRLELAGFSDVQLFGAGGGEFETVGPRLIALAQRGDPPPPRTVSLREVTRENVQAVYELELAPGQERYVAPSAHTLAHGQLEPNAWVRAIYADETTVGLLALIAERDPPVYHLARLMIDARHQGRGFGRAALALLVDHVRELPGAAALETSCVPGPDGPHGFYRSFGFEDTGRVEHGEDVLVLRL